MNIFSTDFISQFSDMLKGSLKKAISDVLLEMKEDEKFFLNRKEIAEVIDCDVDTFDSSFRHLPGFPYHKKGRTEVWNKKEVFEYLHEHKLIK